MKNNSSEKIGVVLMTYGSATTAEHVREYFESIYKGKASETLIKDFENRYRLVGRSPLIEITLKQAGLLEKKLNEKISTYIVRAGMRHSAPRIADAVGECRAAGATHLIGIVMSPQFSSVIMEGYRTAFLNAAREQGFAEDAVVIAGPWPSERHFVQLLAERIRLSLVDISSKHATAMPIPVIFTTHSLPQSVVDKDPSYMDQLMATIDAVRAELSSTAKKQLYQWHAAYQSAGHTPEPWLKPDLTDILDIIARRTIPRNNTKKEEKYPPVLIVPIQFLADHLEILYDLDIAAREQCEARGIAYHRIGLPNTDPLFISALEAIVVNNFVTIMRN